MMGSIVSMGKVDRSHDDAAMPFTRSNTFGLASLLWVDVLSLQSYGECGTKRSRLALKIHANEDKKVRRFMLCVLCRQDS
jgi:hypothetical protein